MASSGDVQASKKPNAKSQFREMDAEQKAEHQRIRAKEISQNELERAIFKVITDNPIVLDQVKELLEGIGHPVVLGKAAKKRGADEFAAPSSVTDTVCVPTAADSNGGDAAAGDQGQGGCRVRASGAGIDDPNPANWLPHRYTRWENCSVPITVELLSHCEPVALSSLALKAITSKGKLDEKQKKLSDHFEFVTGQGRELNLVGSLRHIPTLKKSLKHSSDAEGRRGRDLRVPGDWGAHKDGCFEMEMVGEDLIIKDKTTKAEHVVPPELRLKYADGTLIPIEALEIDINYCKTKANIVSHHCVKNVPIASLGSFGRDVVAKQFIMNPAAAATPPTKKQRAIVDVASRIVGEPETAGHECGVAVASLLQVPMQSMESQWQPPAPSSVAPSALDGSPDGQSLYQAEDASSVGDGRCLIYLDTHISESRYVLAHVFVLSVKVDIYSTFEAMGLNG
ncbi:unnamed protein product [Prorocentrum cordatum]|uniref:Uncharacterized protein n=1 Tax=Prorocentrum cordatum TaxID=2364126 RepID=A0ABN9TL93_9DINO|nr:unnamed protein product [Polarella glacialis]